MTNFLPQLQTPATLANVGLLVDAILSARTDAHGVRVVQPTHLGGLGLSSLPKLALHSAGAPSAGKTMAQMWKPQEGSAVEFWCRAMSAQGCAGTGIRGWFRNGEFWSPDNADRYAVGEVTFWTALRG